MATVWTNLKQVICGSKSLRVFLQAWGNDSLTANSNPPMPANNDIAGTVCFASNTHSRVNQRTPENKRLENKIIANKWLFHARETTLGTALCTHFLQQPVTIPAGSLRSKTMNQKNIEYVSGKIKVANDWMRQHFFVIELPNKYSPTSSWRYLHLFTHCCLHCIW